MQYSKIDRSWNLDWITDQALWALSVDSIDVVEEQQPAWTEQEIAQLYDKLVEESIRQLFACKTPLIQQEIIRWLTVIDDPNPFSFVHCCQAMGLDADDLRDEVLRRYRQQRKQVMH